MSHASTYVAYKGRQLDRSREVWVYRNLRSGKTAGRWSIMQDGVVVGHAGDVTLRDARFVVREGGRQRVIRENKKNVHAFVVGTLIDHFPSQNITFAAVVYNPYKLNTFIRTHDLRPVTRASLVSLGSKCFAADAC